MEQLDDIGSSEGSDEKGKKGGLLDEEEEDDDELLSSLGNKLGKPRVIEKRKRHEMAKDEGDEEEKDEPGIPAKKKKVEPVVRPARYKKGA